MTERVRQKVHALGARLTILLVQGSFYVYFNHLKSISLNLWKNEVYLRCQRRNDTKSNTARPKLDTSILEPLEQVPKNKKNIFLDTWKSRLRRYYTIILSTGLKAAWISISYRFSGEIVLKLREFQEYPPFSFNPLFFPFYWHL